MLDFRKLIRDATRVIGEICLMLNHPEKDKAMMVSLLAASCPERRQNNLGANTATHKRSFCDANGFAQLLMNDLTSME